VLQKPYLKIFSAKYSSYISWLLTLRYIIKNRGHKTFGSQEVIKALDFYRLSWKSGLQDQLMAARLINQIKVGLAPSKSPLKLTRIGPQHDAGYYSHEFNAPLFMISGGAGKNIDFELHFAQRNASVVIYDPTVASLPAFHQNIIHKKFFLGSANSADKKVLSYQEMLSIEKINLSNYSINILKLDIEGSELFFLGKENCSLDMFDEIIIEIHNLYRILDSDFRGNLAILLSNLLHRHIPVMTNANNNGVKFCIGDNTCPEVIEVTLLHKKYFLRGINRDFEVPSPMTNNIERIGISF